MSDITDLFEQEDEIEAKIFELNKERAAAKKNGEKDKAAEISAQIKALEKENKAVIAQAKKKQDEYAQFNRAAKPYLDARKLLLQKENYSHFDEIAALYEEAKINADQEDREKEELAALKRAEQEAELAAKKAEKAMKKAEKADKKSNKKQDK